MPYEIRKTASGKYEIYNKDKKKVVGTSDSKAKAKASIRARYAGEHGWKGTKGK